MVFFVSHKRVDVVLSFIGSLIEFAVILNMIEFAIGMSMNLFHTNLENWQYNIYDNITLHWLLHSFSCKR